MMRDAGRSPTTVDREDNVVSEHKDAGRSDQIEERQRKVDQAQSAAIQAAKLTQQQANESGQHQLNDPKPQVSKEKS